MQTYMISLLSQTNMSIGEQRNVVLAVFLTMSGWKGDHAPNTLCLKANQIFMFFLSTTWLISIYDTLYKVSHCMGYYNQLTLVETGE